MTNFDKYHVFKGFQDNMLNLFKPEDMLNYFKRCIEHNKEVEEWLTPLINELEFNMSELYFSDAFDIVMNNLFK